LCDSFLDEVLFVEYAWVVVIAFDGLGHGLCARLRGLLHEERVRLVVVFVHRAS